MGSQTAPFGQFRENEREFPFAVKNVPRSNGLGSDCEGPRSRGLIAASKEKVLSPGTFYK